MDFAPLIALELALYAYKSALFSRESDEVIRERLEAFKATVEDAIAQYPETSEKSPSSGDIDSQII